MGLFRITAVVEADDITDAEAVMEQIGKAICPHPNEDDHVCPRGWITMLSELDDEEAAVWAEPDALNR
jgi:desulfoferrodoxin (superoxide reductase-like protein)